MHDDDQSDDAELLDALDTEDGLPDVEEDEPASLDPFFVTKKAAAVLKHGILKGYLTPFASKVGSTSKDHRVALLDGYAGPGRYRDGTEGSPALLAVTASTVKEFRTVECHLVEHKRTNFKLLKEFLDGAGAELRATPYRGSVEDHLAVIMAATNDVPLFAYLDPFGFGIPFDDVVTLLKRHPSGNPATEVLLNFTANGIRRAGGLLRPGRTISTAEEKILARADLACGDDWWREIVSRHLVENDDLEAAVSAVALEYMRRVCAAARTRGFALDVRNREHHKPVYYLIFFTRHRDGMWLFNQAVSGAQHEWRQHLAPPAWTPDPDLLFDIPHEPSFEEEERERAAAWVVRLKANILALAAGAPFTVGDRMTDVYEGVLGEARETHVRSALKQLCKEDAVETASKNSIGASTVGAEGEVPTMRVSLKA